MASFLCGEFLLHTPCCLILMQGVSLTLPVLAVFCFLNIFYLGNISNTSSAHFCLIFYLGSFSYTSRASFIFIGGVSLTHPVLVLFLCREFLTCYLHFCAGSLSDTSHAAFVFMRGVSLTHPKLPSFLCGEFLLHFPCWLLLSGEILLHILSWLPFYVGSLYYRSRADFFAMQGVSLTHPALAFLLLLLMWGASFLCSLLWRQSLNKRVGWKLDQEKSAKKSHSDQRKSPRTSWVEQNKTKEELSERWAQERKRKKRNGSDL